jgi:excinuclease ABC subunit A
MLKGLKDIVSQGNTVIVVDHSDFIQKNADHLVVMGPGSGKNGGELLYNGEPHKYFVNQPKEKINSFKKVDSKKSIKVLGAQIFNKNYPDFEVPLDTITWVSGPSGSGKSACIIKVLSSYLLQKISNENIDDDKFTFSSINGMKNFNDVIVVSSNLNRFTSRSNVGTITELSSVIRKHFLKLPVAKSMNLKEGHLSPNSELGMCPKCEGKGVNIIEMQYLEDIVIECEECRGLKLKPIYANLSDGSMTLAEAYQLPLNQVLEKLDLTPKFKRVWEYLKILNLDYLSLERGLSSLSGGEKQRIYLLSKLLKKIENSFIVLENISFGLSNRELNNLSELLHSLVQFSNTVVVIDSSDFFKKISSYHLHFENQKISLEKL